MIDPTPGCSFLPQSILRALCVRCGEHALAHPGVERLQDPTNLILSHEIAARMGYPSAMRAATVLDRLWLGTYCWNCKRVRADCECIFP